MSSYDRKKNTIKAESFNMTFASRHVMTHHFGIYTLDILFLSNHNIHKSLCGLCFWASDPLIDRVY